VTEWQTEKGLRQICEADDMPDRVTFLRWVDQQIKRAVPINGERPLAEIFGVLARRRQISFAAMPLRMIQTKCAMANGRCRMHGGPSPGAPKGNQNAFKHGRYSAFSVRERRYFAVLIREMRGARRR
jgi:hypothetical protein